MELETQSTLLGTKKEGRFLLPLTSGQSNYTIKVLAEQCGELRFSCKRICVRDVLNLFNVQTAPFAPVRTVIYPRRMKVQLLLSQASAGTPQPEGKMQNRKGNDPSEMFDLREYARLVLLTGQLHPRVRAAGKGGLRRHRARGV